MALVAIHAVVYITANVAMIAIRVRLGVAVRALEDAIVGRIRVTRRADSVCVAVIDVEPGVIESGAQPTRGGVASSARGRESRRRVIRIVRGLVFRLMTTKAIGRHRGVVVVHVTACTRHGRVLSRQGEAGVVVVETCGTPGCRTVAYLALLREAGRNVAGIVCALEIFQMAADTSRNSNVVVGVRVTLAALQTRVSARKRPSGRCVIERCRIPVRRRMANLALLRETGRRVVGVVRALKVFQMAANASRAAQIVVPVGMALRARHADMRSCERESGLGVIEGRRLPR